MKTIQYPIAFALNKAFPFRACTLACLATLVCVEGHAAGALACSTQGNTVYLEVLPANKDALMAAGVKFEVLPSGHGANLKATVPEGKAVRAGNNGGVCTVELLEPPKSSTAKTSKINVASTEAGSVTQPESSAAAKPPKDDWIVPSAPAFELIGASPNLANLPKDPRELAAHLVAGRASDGSIQKGIAIDASLSQLLQALPLIGAQFPKPYMAQKVSPPNAFQKSLAALNLGLTDEDHITVTRFADRLKVSLATTQEEGKASAPIRLGLGLHYTLWDYATHAAKNTCKDIGKQARALQMETTSASTTAELATQIYNTGGESALKAACAEKDTSNAIEFFARPAAAIGYGASYSLTEGKWSNRVSTTKGFWLTAATGGLALSTDARSSSAPRAQLIFHTRWFQDQPTAAVPAVAAVAATSTTPAIAAVAAIPASFQDIRLIAGRLKIGQPNGGFSYEYARGKRMPLTGAKENTSRRAYGFEWRVGKDTWLVASGGDETSSISGQRRQPFVVTTLRFGGDAGKE